MLQSSRRLAADARGEVHDVVRGEHSGSFRSPESVHEAEAVVAGADVALALALDDLDERGVGLISPLVERDDGELCELQHRAIRGGVAGRDLDGHPKALEGAALGHGLGSDVEAPVRAVPLQLQQLLGIRELVHQRLDRILGGEELRPNPRVVLIHEEEGVDVGLSAVRSTLKLTEEGGECGLEARHGREFLTGHEDALQHLAARLADHGHSAVVRQDEAHVDADLLLHHANVAVRLAGDDRQRHAEVVQPVQLFDELPGRGQRIRGGTRTPAAAAISIQAYALEIEVRQHWWAPLRK